MIFSADRVPGYSKKIQFESLLENESGGRKYKVIVGYEWKKTDQILSLRVTDDHVLRLWININFYKDRLFGSNEKAKELSLRYRAYYISAYIRCLEDAVTSIPASYHSGLVLLCAINSICGKKRISYSPVSKKRMSQLRPIDIHCAAEALMRLVKDCKDILSENEKDSCNKAINSFLTYSLLPEVSYEKGRPVHALLYELKEYRKNVSKGRVTGEKFPLFMGYEENGLMDLPLSDLISGSIRDRNAFWMGAVLRLILVCDRSLEIGTEHADNLKEYIINKKCFSCPA